MGVPLPPAAGKMRIALTVAEQAVLERSPPPSLPAVFLAADPAWGPTIHALVALGARHSVSPAAFGSLLWQYLTGLPYLSPRSDLDVIWPVRADCEIGALVAGIAAAELGAPMRIDGEVVFPDGDAVNWRELPHGAQSGQSNGSSRQVDRRRASSRRFLERAENLASGMTSAPAFARPDPRFRCKTIGCSTLSPSKPIAPCCSNWRRGQSRSRQPRRRGQPPRYGRRDVVRSAEALRPFFAELALAGWRGAGMNQLRAIGMRAEAAMLSATGGVNTHRGAISASACCRPPRGRSPTFRKMASCPRKEDSRSAL